MEEINKTQAAINILLSICFCDPYLPINGLEARDLLGMNFEKIYGLDSTKLKLQYILDNYIYNNVENVNSVFFKDIVQNIELDFDSKNKLAINFKKLIDYSTEEDIPIIRFPTNTISCDLLNPLINSHVNSNNFLLDSRGVNYFIMFVDKINLRLQGCILEPVNEFTNYLSHEIGHCIDPIQKKMPTDFVSDLDYNKYRYQREIDAWESAKALQKELGIKNTQIEIQTEKSLTLYREFYFGENQIS